MKLTAALAKLDRFFEGRDTRPGVVARQLLGREAPGDSKLAELLCNERRARTRMDGSIGESLLETAWAAWEMMDLGLETATAGLDRLVGWVLGKIEGGAPIAEPLPVTLPNGLTLAAPEAASFGVHCLGLRVLLRARHEDRPAVVRHIEALATGAQPVTIELSACGLGALALVRPPHRHHLDGLVARIGRAQGEDGTWTGADLFHMLEGLVLAGIRPARALVTRAAPALLGLQRADGAFDDPPHEERALIGLRALQIAAED